jgi:hypothetical protein
MFSAIIVLFPCAENNLSFVVTTSVHSLKCQMFINDVKIFISITLVNTSIN